jgi:predicted MPP superfamily phosphohydrolase
MSMALRALIFLTVVLVVLGGSCAYMALRSMALCPPLAVRPWLVWGAVGLFVVSLFAVPALHRLPGLGPRVEPLFAVSYGLFSFMSTYLVYLAAADLVQALVRLATGVRLGPWAVAAAAAAAVLSILLGLATALRPPVLRRVAVPVAGLAPGLEGLRIVQISDLHLGPLVSTASVDQLVARTNALEPDLVAVTGDLVDGEADGTRALAVRLGAIRATHGVFFVTGNHEYYSGVDRWLEVIRELGWRNLHNDHALLEHRGARLAVAGLPDPTGRSRPNGGPNLDRALAGLPADALPILLYHPPTGAAAAERAGVRLQLSGHTHAGQYFPWSLLIPRLYDHGRGLSREGRMWVYTSVGTGFWGPPNRFLVPPELTLLTLVAGRP